MKAAFVVEPGKVEIRQVDIPVICGDEVLIKVKTAGLCESDLRLFNGTHAEKRPPAILGHQVAGEIAAIGNSVKGFRIGDRVTVEPHRGCGVCDLCKQGLISLCADRIVPGTPAWTGAFAEYFSAPARIVYRLGDDVRFEMGTLVEPLALAVHALHRIAHSQRDSIAVLGCGAVGLMALVVAREAGYRNIAYADTRAFNLAIAIKQGAKLALNMDNEDIVSKVLAFTGGQGADAVLIAADTDKIVDLAIAMAKRRGAVGIMATVARPVPADSSRYTYRDRTMFVATTYRTRDFSDAVRMVNSGLDLNDFLTQRFTLSQSQKALEMFSTGEEPVVKMVVEIDE